jgi:Raf kinase inhibitor-like YbhB/YbcL family protein
MAPTAAGPGLLGLSLVLCAGCLGAPPVARMTDGGIGGGSGGSVTGTGGSVTGTGGSVTGTGGSATGTGGSATDAGSDTKTDTVVADTGTDSAIDASPATITVTSTSLTEGATFMATNTCAGANTSPPLSWTAGPTGTMSYTVSLTDLSVAGTAVQWILWDIPATTTALPAMLPAGSPLTTPISAMQLHQAAFFGAGTNYRGPCPGASGPHNYQFQVNAIGTATLAGTAGMTTDQIQALAQPASLAHGNLNGVSSAMMPPADAGG